MPKQDLTAARSLMVEAGYDRKLALKWLLFAAPATRTSAVFQEIVQDQLAEIGINTTIETLDVGTWRERAFTQYDYDIYSYSAPAHEIPERFHNLFVSRAFFVQHYRISGPGNDAAIEFAGASADQAGVRGTVGSLPKNLPG